jgi:flagellar biosynthesis chaperone FliJ
MEENLCQYSSIRELISIIYKELKKLNTKRANNLINKWANELSRHFSNKEVQIVNKYMKTA